jgi:hypothetical protein
MILNMKKNIVETEFGQAVYVTSDTIKDDMLFLIKNNIKGVIITNDNGYILDNVDFFKEYDFIEIVIVSAYKEIDYSGIHYLINLKILILNILSKENQYIDFSKFPNLIDCRFNWRAKAISLFDCTSLEYLNITKYKGTDLDKFEKLVNLKTLCIGQSAIETLNGITKLTSLVKLDLFNNRKLSSFNGISVLKHLKEFSIDSCKGLSEINEISQLENLEKLKINNCGDIESVKPIVGLKNLKEFYFQDSTNVVDGDISPCIGLSKTSFQDRKHYNYKYQEIKNLSK